MRQAAGWESVIVGGGPAGLAAGLHLARAGYRVLLVESGRLGGQARGLGRIENYPGFPAGIDGGRLMERWVRQARRWGLRTRHATVRRARRGARGFLLSLGQGRALAARSVVYCPGAPFDDLALAQEKRLRGRGVFHAAFDRAGLWSGRTVAVAGGGEAAAHQALALSRRARKVYLICRGGAVKAHRLLQGRLRRDPRIERLLDARVLRLHGRRRLEAVEVFRRGARRRLAVDALFVLVGKVPPRLPFPAGRLPPGFFVGGDAAGEDRQVVVAAGSGVKAAMRCIGFLEGRP